MSDIEEETKPVVAKEEEAEVEQNEQVDVGNENGNDNDNDNEEGGEVREENDNGDEAGNEGQENDENEEEADGGNDAGNSDDELSDLDEDQIEELDNQLPIDEQVYKMSSHKRASSERRPRAPKEKTRPKKRATAADSDEAGARKSRSRARSMDADDDDSRESTPEEDLDPETRKKREIERRLDEALKPTSKRRKKLDGDDIEQMQDEAVSNLREQMRNAAIEDAECIKNGVPAVNKLRMLPRVEAVLQKASLADSILDNNLLEAVRMWLEPLPDASLPAYAIQKVMFQAIDKLPIKTIHLRESGLGKVVYFYQRSKRPQLDIKRTADRLIGNWTRPIMGRSDNYRDKYVASRSYSVEDPSTAAANAAMNTKSMDDKRSINQMSAAEAAAVRRNRAFIPDTGTQSFQVAPKSIVTSAIPGRAPLGSGDEFKRLRQRMTMKGRAKTKKSGVSIEGKDLSLK
uniref:Transcription factor IWS1 n=1 Tax=Blastobotrys adeninivorans TaxID=409370 RepID=A0A060SY25_BLAAD